MIKLNDLAIGYNGEAILEHIDQEFDDGLIYGILAKSGAGKTTLLKTIAGLLRPVHGTPRIRKCWTPLLLLSTSICVISGSLWARRSIARRL